MGSSVSTAPDTNGAPSFGAGLRRASRLAPFAMPFGRMRLLELSPSKPPAALPYAQIPNAKSRPPFLRASIGRGGGRKQAALRPLRARGPGLVLSGFHER